MNKIFFLVMILIFGVACSSSETKREVKQEAAGVTPTVNPNIQYNRAVAMIEANPDLSLEQKGKLIMLINRYSQRSLENREKQSQYRTVLINEMLGEDNNANAKIAIAKKNITSLNKENSQNLEVFVNDFKNVIGKTANYNQPEILEVILLE